MKLSDAIEQANIITLPQHKLCEIINKQSELLDDAKKALMSCCCAPEQRNSTSSAPTTFRYFYNKALVDMVLTHLHDTEIL